jgi:light-regulated signal transduction histidine kinase (bacteriophytochrome)
MATRELIAPEDRSGADELEARLREGRCERFQNETRYVRADGSALWVHLTVVAIRDAGGRVTRRIATIEDVSERKRAEVALGEANRRKDEFVAELARSNEELERFAYVASHDLQEPLRTVASFTQLLARRYRDKLDSEANEFIHFTLDAVARMQALIDALLALSRVGTHGRPLQPTRSEDTLTDALRDLSGQIHKTGAAVTHDPLPTVMADPVQLGQVFRNLLSNALKFRSEQPPRIHVSARQEHDHWIFSMADNGIGISEEHFERIFVIFLRLHTRQEFPGTGLGLAMCKKIVERHGGRIWVESTPQRGSVFHFSLPVAAASEPASGSVALPGWRSTLRGSP